MKNYKVIKDFSILVEDCGNKFTIIDNTDKTKREAIQGTPNVVWSYYKGQNVGDLSEFLIGLNGDDKFIKKLLKAGFIKEYNE